MHRRFTHALLLTLIVTCGAFIAPTRAQVPSTPKMQPGGGLPYEIADSEV